MDELIASFSDEQKNLLLSIAQMNPQDLDQRKLNTILDKLGIKKSQLPKLFKAYQKKMRPDHVTRQRTKIGRNEPCPCESGLKYKKCCGC